MSSMLARGVLIGLSCLLLVYTWILYRDVKNVSSGPGSSSDSHGGGPKSGLSSGRSGEGSAVRCFHLQLEAPKPSDTSRSSFRVRENSPGVALREALGAGAVRYCSKDGKVYRAAVARRDGVPDSRFDVLLSSPVDEDDPTSFPVGVAADEGYVLPPPDAEAGGKSGDNGTDPPYTDAFLIFF